MGYIGHRTAVFRYGTAVLVVVFAIALRMFADPLLGDRVPFALIVGAVTVAAFLGGQRPGLLAMLLGTLGTWYFFTPPRHSFTFRDAGDAIQTLTFAGVGAVVAVLVGSLQEANEAVRAGKEHLQVMVAAMPEILFTGTPDGRFDSVSERFVQYSGKNSAELIGNGWSSCVHPEDRDGSVTAWRRSVESGTEHQSEYRLRRRDGVYRWFQCHAVPFRDGQGRIVKWFGVCSDVDDRKHLEEDLARRSHELARSNEDLERFAYSASHDLQEPIRVVALFTQLLARKYGHVDPDSKELADEILKGVARMQDLIAGLLEYSKATQSGASPKGPVSLNQALADALWTLRPLIQESGARIIEQHLPDVVADSRLMSNVFQNLIANAIKYRGENLPEIRITAEKGTDAWVIAVADNGIGIQQEYTDRIFGIFQRLHGREIYSGAGIGLATVKRIIEHHRGKIWVESTPGKGSTFYFTLPSTERGRSLQRT